MASESDMSFTRTAALMSPSSMSVEEERDSLRERCEHLQIFFRHQTQEHQRAKDGLENLTRLLQECRKENALLHKRVRSQETVIRTLQSRLVSNGFSASIGIEETDIFTPGTSNQVFENLVKEISRLRMNQSSATDSVEADRLRTELQACAENLEDKKHELKRLHEEYAAFKKTIALSPNEKDAKIVEMKTAIEKMKEEFQTSLSEETYSLRQQLQDIAANCQQLAQRLEQSEKAQKSASSGPVAEKQQSQDDSNTVEKIRHIELQQKFSEVVKMNKRWQSYDQEREKSVKKLTADYERVNHDLKNAQAELSQMSARLEEAEINQLTPEQKKQIDEGITQAQKRLQREQNENKHLKTIIQKLKEDISNKNSEIERLQRELATTNSIGHLQSDAEIVGVLKTQIQLCTEDFECERKEKDKLRSQLQRVELENNKLRSDLSRMIGSERPYIGLGRQGNLGMASSESYQEHEQRLPHYFMHEGRQLAARGSSGNVDSKITVDGPSSGGGSFGDINCKTSGGSFGVNNYNAKNTVKDTREKTIHSEHLAFGESKKEQVEKKSPSEKSFESPPKETNSLNKATSSSDKGCSSIGSLNFPSLNETDDDSFTEESVLLKNNFKESNNFQNSDPHCEEVLSCPKCQEKFSDKDLLDHVTECCD